MLDILPDNESLTWWITHYGSITLFVLLLLGIVAFPIPEETLMVITGFLISQGTVSLIPNVIAAYLGSMCGITISYLVGRFIGKYVILKYGGWIGITEQRMLKTHYWFEEYGKWTLVIGYYIPGVRHFTGLLAGTAYLEYREFAKFAYFGAFIWVTTFLSLGYFVGDYCLKFGNYCIDVFHEIEISDTWITVGIVIAVLAIAIYIRKRFFK